jgi:hypothetical protein
MALRVQKYPEWRQLMAAIKPLLDKKKTQFSYDELKELCGSDVRGDRGRQQFYRFRKQALKDWQVWFENIPAFGYAVVPPADQPKAALKKAKSARRRINEGKAINTQVRIEDMTPTQRMIQAQVSAMLQDISQAMNRAGRQFAAVASKLQMDISEEDVALIADKRKKVRSIGS